jgi:two-component system nitrate/nitrite response regulator NarL
MIKLALADDHQSITDGIKLLVENRDNIEFVGVANDGEELLKLVEHKRPNIVITDLRMPKLDGIEATKAIKKNFPEIKILALSMFDQQDAVRQMIDAGVSGYVLKNSSFEHLLEAIEKVDQGETFFDIELEEDKVSAYNCDNVLTNRQEQILQLIAQGKTTREIADELFIGVYTVDTHRKNMMRLLGLKGKGELLRYAINIKYDF